MEYIATLHIPDFGLVSARYTGSEPLARCTQCIVERGSDRAIGVLRSLSPLIAGRQPPKTRILRAATEDDFEEQKRCLCLAEEAESAFAALVAKYAFPIRCIRVHVFLGRARLILWHSPAESDLNLRSFEGEFRRKVRCNVEICEASPRLVAALLGGCGCCGKELCCVVGRTPAREFSPQEASHLAGSTSSMTVHGLCNRPKCCLSFES